MSVMNYPTDVEEELINQFNTLESKVFILQETCNTIEARLSKMEALARKHGVDLKVDTKTATAKASQSTEGEACTIN